MDSHLDVFFFFDCLISGDCLVLWMVAAGCLISECYLVLWWLLVDWALWWFFFLVFTMVLRSYGCMVVSLIHLSKGRLFCGQLHTPAQYLR